MLHQAVEPLGHSSNFDQRVPTGDVLQVSKNVLKLLFESVDTPKPLANVLQSSDYKYPTVRTLALPPWLSLGSSGSSDLD
jgi:hypothetical protein